MTHEEINRDVARFLAAGGKIEHVPAGLTSLPKDEIERSGRLWRYELILSIFQRTAGNC